MFGVRAAKVAAAKSERESENKNENSMMKDVNTRPITTTTTSGSREGREIDNIGLASCIRG